MQCCQNDLWKTDDREMGLFTFYRDGFTKDEPNPLDDIKSKFRIKNQVNVLNRSSNKTRFRTKRYVTEMTQKISQTKQMKVPKKIQPLTASMPKYDQLHQWATRSKQTDSLKVNKRQEQFFKTKNKSNLHLKTSNLNEKFDFDINRLKTQMFIYQRQKEKKAGRKVSQERQTLRRSIEDDGPSILSLRRIEKDKSSKSRLGQMKNTRFNFLNQLADRKKYNKSENPQHKKKQTYFKKLIKVDKPSKTYLMRIMDEGLK